MGTPPLWRVSDCISYSGCMGLRWHWYWLYSEWRVRILITDSDAFEREALLSNLPVVAEFTTEVASGGELWGELVAGMDKEYAGRARFAVVDVELCCDIAEMYAIKSVPEFLAFYVG